MTGFLCEWSKTAFPQKTSESTIIKHLRDETKYLQVQYNTDRIMPGCFPLCMSQAKTCFASAAVRYFDMLL